MKINKSSRHSKITGDFAENLILYWMSKYGFECARVDHTGIDIIARRPHSKEVMGISVKSRSRNAGKEGTFLSIPNDNFIKAKKACQDFKCTPYFAIVVDQKDKIYVFILSMEHLLKIFPRGNRVVAWKMTDKYIERYRKDPKIKVIEFNYKII